MMPMFPAIFLDRDGVIIENRPQYVRHWGDVQIFPEALAALARLKDSPYKIVIVTNQAGIGRGLIPICVAEEINRRLREEAEKAGGRIDAVYVCPHRPDEGCSCRKPLPGLILQAAQELNIDLSRSVMIGDALTDLEAGFAAKVGQVALVQTGLGQETLHSPKILDLAHFSIYADLAQALEDLTQTAGSD